VVFFLHDITPAHQALATQKKLFYVGFQSLNYPSYSPDLNLSDYHLFSALNKQLKGRHFSSNTEVIAATGTRSDWANFLFFLSDSQKLQQRAKNYVELRGECVE
jgi:hypothetical protein